MLGGFFLLLLVFDEKDLILDFFYDKFEVNVFLGLILNCESEFVDGVFQELESKLVLAFQLNVKNSPDGNLHLVRINWDKFVIFGGEGLLDFIEGEERIKYERCTVKSGFGLGLDEELVIF